MSATQRREALLQLPAPENPTITDPPQEFDEPGQELGRDAHVWKTYVKEADTMDAEQVDGWKQ